MAEEFFVGDRVRCARLGEGVVALVDGVPPYVTLTVDFDHQGRHVVEPRQVGLEVVERGEAGRKLLAAAPRPAVAPGRRLDDDLAKALRRLLREELGIRDLPIGERWEGGELVLVPGKSGLQEKRIPLESFFGKLVMVRERLRVLEQKINNHPKLDASDRLELQGYLTKIAGSLTTFNVLFAERDDWFVGEKSSS